MSQDRLWYAIRIMGRWVILIPPLIILLFILLGGILTIMQVGHLRISQVLTASLEMVLPLAASLLTTTIVSYDSAIELQMTMPKAYRINAFVRLSLIIAWISCLSSEILACAFTGRKLERFTTISDRTANLDCPTYMVCGYRLLSCIAHSQSFSQ